VTTVNCALEEHLLTYLLTYLRTYLLTSYANAMHHLTACVSAASFSLFTVFCIITLSLNYVYLLEKLRVVLYMSYTVALLYFGPDLEIAEFTGR